MKIVELTMPLILDYYVVKNNIDYSRHKLLTFDAQLDDNYIIIDLDDDFIIYEVMKMIIIKTEKITVGNQLKYEYELDIHSSRDSHLFKFLFDNGVEVKAKLISIKERDNHFNLKFQKL